MDEEEEEKGEKTCGCLARETTTFTAAERGGGGERTATTVATTIGEGGGGGDGTVTDIEEIGDERGARHLNTAEKKTFLFIFFLSFPTTKHTLSSSSSSSCAGRVHSIDSFTAVDGHGIRAIIFLQGCSKRCLFCCNPAGDGGRRRLRATVLGYINQFSWKQQKLNNIYHTDFVASFVEKFIYMNCPSGAVFTCFRRRRA